MSYVLHVWDKPAPASVDEASRIVFEWTDRGGPNPLFSRFTQALTAVYPDADALEQAGGDMDDAVWVDSPLDGQTDEAIFVLGMVTGRMDDEILPFIAHTAADLGLYVFDMQGGSSTGRIAAFSTPTDAARPCPPGVRRGRAHVPSLSLPRTAQTAA